MTLRTFFAFTLFACSSSGVMRAMDEQTTYSLSNVKKAVNCKKFFMELGSAVSSDTPFTYESLFSLLATIRYERLPELFSLEKEVGTTFIHFKKLHNFFQFYCERTVPERIETFKKCLKFKALEQFFGCTGLEKGLNLWAQITTCKEADQKNMLIQQLKALLEELIKTSKDRASTGTAKNALLTTYLDLERALLICNDLEKGVPIGAERYSELVKGAALLNSCGVPVESYEQYCSLTKLTHIIVSFLTASEHTSPRETILSCLRWDGIAEQVVRNLLEDEAETFVSILQLKTLMKRLQAGEVITGAEIASLIAQKDLLTYLEKERVDWNSCADMLNALRAGTYCPTARKTLQHLSDILGLPLAQALDSFFPEDVQRDHMKDLIEQCTDPDWFMRFKYALPFVGGLLTLWLAGHSLCHPCMEFIEPQSWYTAGPLGLGAVYLTARFGQFFTSPTKAKSALVNIVLTKCARLCSWGFAGAITKDQLIKKAIEMHPTAQDPFKAFLGTITYEHLNKLPNTRFDMLKLLENPLMFMYTTQPFVEGVLVKESYKTEEEYQKALEAFSVLLTTLIKKEALTYTDMYLTVTKMLDQKSKDALESPTLLEIAHYNPTLLLNYPTFFEKVDESEATINSSPLSTWFLLLMASYKEFLRKTGGKIEVPVNQNQLSEQSDKLLMHDQNK